jgi:eukaryotic-like serine/threonine-protein kinase
MPFSPGGKLGPYEILSPIGVGGMGEAYRATETRDPEPFLAEFACQSR